MRLFRSLSAVFCSMRPQLGGLQASSGHARHLVAPVMRSLAVLVMVATGLGLLACSETELRLIYEEPTFYEQPDALAPTRWTDTFQQRTVEASDILFVVDSSCSMQDEQEELAANFESFIQTFVNSSTIDYHVGVVEGALNADDSENWGILEQLPDGSRWIDPDTGSSADDKIAAFTEISNVGTDGPASCEMGLQAARSALSYQTYPGRPNEGFYREEALLSLVILSDEPDHGQDSGDPLFGGGGCGGVHPDEFIPWFLYDLKGQHNQDLLVFTGIVGDRPGGCGDSNNGADEGAGYWEVIDGVEGNFLSICDDDWSEFLTQLGLESAGLKRSFHLKRSPSVSSLSVTLNGVEADSAIWSYNPITNAIDFPVEHMPEELAMIEVSYFLIEDQGSTAPPE